MARARSCGAVVDRVLGPQPLEIGPHGVGLEQVRDRRRDSPRGAWNRPWRGRPLWASLERSMANRRSWRPPWKDIGSCLDHASHDACVVCHDDASGRSRPLATRLARSISPAMFIQTETTPNPEVLKFLPGREVLGEGAREFKHAEEGDASPLAKALFDLGDVNAGVLRSRLPDGDQGRGRRVAAPEGADPGRHHGPLHQRPAPAAGRGRPRAATTRTASMTRKPRRSSPRSRTCSTPASVRPWPRTAATSCSAVRAGHRRGLAAHARRLLGLPVVFGHAEGRRREHAQALCAGSDPGRADALGALGARKQGMRPRLAAPTAYIVTV
jgi:hypothetical protein